MSDTTSILPTSDGHHDRMDLGMIRRAIREGWDIKPEWKKTLPTRMARIVADPDSKNREAIGAFQALRMAEADRVDQMFRLYGLENADASPQHPTIDTVNINNNGPIMASLAADPDRFREFAKLAATVKQDAPPP